METTKNTGHCEYHWRLFVRLEISSRFALLAHLPIVVQFHAHLVQQSLHFLAGSPLQNAQLEHGSLQELHGEWRRVLCVQHVMVGQKKHGGPVERRHAAQNGRAAQNHAIVATAPVEHFGNEGQRCGVARGESCEDVGVFVANLIRFLISFAGYLETFEFKNHLTENLRNNNWASSFSKIGKVFKAISRFLEISWAWSVSVRFYISITVHNNI